jgi:RNA polymerase sigma-70 factor, ECF subfamily
VGYSLPLRPQLQLVECLSLELPRASLLLRNFVASPVFATLLRAMAANLDPDAALMLRVREGDRAAFEELVEKYKQPVINIVARTLHDFTEAEDVAQHVFVQVYKSAHRYEVTAKFSTWLFTIARNLALNEIRRRSRHPADSLDQTFEGEDEHPVRQAADTRSAGPTEHLLREELESKVEEAIAELPEKQRTALLMCRHEEFSYDEIAQVVGCSLSATKSLIHRARETLKARLKPYLRSGAWQED